MGTRDVYQKVLVRACLVAGDETALANALGVPVESVIGWLLRDGKVPIEVFLRAVDIVLASSKELVRENHAFLQRIRQDRKISQRGVALAFIESQSGILERLSHGAPLETVLALLVLAMESLSDGALGSVLLLAADGRVKHAAAPSLPQAYLKAIDGQKIGPASGSCGAAIHLGRTVIVADIATDPLWRSHRKHALKHGLRACWAAPIVSSGGVILGAFALYYREPREPRPHERQLVEVAAELAAIAISRNAAQSAAPVAEPVHAALSRRELQIVRLIAQGEPVKRIAQELGLTISTVYTHRARIFDKLGIRSNVRLVRYAIHHRMVR
jgi:DNA-binding CsgD family transcriptional regulator